MKRLCILGSTGSIGTQTLDVIRQFPDAFGVESLAAGRNITLLAAQIAEFRPKTVSVVEPTLVAPLKTLLAQKNLSIPRIEVGDSGLVALATQTEADLIVVGLVGFAGLLPTLEGLKIGKRVLTANKETFVTAGHLVSPYLEQIVPLDSEHSALFQCLQGAKNPPKEVRKLYLTASGGPFRNYTPEMLRHVTVESALKHPNWSMGQKVTIDSASMMNKGLEIIEAQHLFQMPLNKIEVVVHPQSIVHSAVAYQDGSIIAQMGQPEMRVPIQYGLTYPERWETRYQELHLDLTTLGQLDFLPADPERFPCLRLARWAAEARGSMPVVLNAADEIAVQAFLDGKIGFMEIPQLIESVMTAHQAVWIRNPDLAEIIHVDSETRQRCKEALERVPVIFG